MSYTRLVGFGEAMLRLSVREGASLETAASLDVNVGGAELNGLIAANRAGMAATWLSALPTHPLGRLVRRHAMANGVVPWTVPIVNEASGRVGTYYLELASPPRPHRIVYDRARSVFADLDPHQVDWDEWLDSDTCLYLSGITPPLGDGPRKALDQALHVAKERGATVALDVNYRSALWSRDEASRWLRGALPDVDILCAGTTDLADVGLGDSDVLADAVEVFGLQALVSTAKELDGNRVEVRLRAITPQGEAQRSAQATVIDPLGAGDAMFGTFLATFPGSDLDRVAEAALGAAVSCYGIHGDALTADAWDPAEVRGIVR